MIQPLKYDRSLTPCQKLCVEDCRKALANKKHPDPLSIAGQCPGNCNVCLYAERFKRDDINWIPSPSEPQYRHYLERS